MPPAHPRRQLGDGAAQRPFVIDSAQVANIIRDARTRDPNSNVKIAIYSSDGKEALGLEVRFPANLPTNQASVGLLNVVKSNWEREMGMVNDSTCTDTQTLRIAGGGWTGLVNISSTSTSRLAFRKPIMPFPFYVYWDTMFVFTAQDFWTAFGGRSVIISWQGD